MGECNRDVINNNPFDLVYPSYNEYDKCLSKIVRAKKSPECTGFIFHYKKELDKFPFKDFVCILNDCSNFSHRPSLDKFFAKKETIPSLLQLSRDAVRRIMFHKQIKEDGFKSSDGIHKLSLTQDLKDILVLKRGIY
nr:uncharacterized protein LOC111418145 [Onthophagus taurus]